MRRASVILWAAIGVLLLASPALSHHAFTSEFDYTKTVTFTGVITKVEWINPHAYFYLEARDRDGRVTAWTIESFPPAALRKAGMTRETMKIGDAVTIQAYPAKDSEDTWLDIDGDIHSSSMHVVERLTRKGNTLRYEVTVEDPVMLTKPWSPRPRTELLGKPGEHIEQNYPCSERSTPHLANEDRH